MLKPLKIVIFYFTANGKEWITVWYTPYNPKYIKKIKAVPTTHYDAAGKYWYCEAKYGKKIETIVKECFPDNTIDFIVDFSKYESKKGIFLR